MRTVAWLTVVLLGISSTAVAQPRRGSGSAAPVERRGGGTVERREQLKERIRAMRAYTLTSKLALDEQTAGRLFAVLSRYDEEIDKTLEKRVDLQRRLVHADALRDPRAIDRLIDDAAANQRAMWDLEDKRLADLRKILTPVQTAKLLVVLPATERRIQNQLRKAILQRRGGGAAIDDGDDDLEPDEAPPAKQPLRRREGPLAPRGWVPNAPGNTPPCDPRSQPCR